MPQGVPISAIPNQAFSVTLDGVDYDFVIRETADCMSVSISAGGTQIIENARAVACMPIIPAQYLEDSDGNFMFLTANNQIPNWQQFNLTQSLLYFSAAELATYRTPPIAASPKVPTVTASYFDPMGQLPLRFAPQNYTSG